MTKKEYLLELIDTLGDAWQLGEPIKTLLEGNSIDNATLDAVYKIVSEVVNTTADGMKQEKLKKWLSILEKIKALESEEESHKQQELDELLAKL